MCLITVPPGEAPAFQQPLQAQLLPPNGLSRQSSCIMVAVLAQLLLFGSVSKPRSFSSAPLNVQLFLPLVSRPTSCLTQPLLDQLLPSSWWTLPNSYPPGGLSRHKIFSCGPLLGQLLHPNGSLGPCRPLQEAKLLPPSWGPSQARLPLLTMSTGPHSAFWQPLLAQLLSSSQWPFLCQSEASSSGFFCVYLLLPSSLDRPRYCLIVASPGPALASLQPAQDQLLPA
ncbi:hypothetical protein P7K49_005261, partial [Saguinus oedipus]